MSNPIQTIELKKPDPKKLGVYLRMRGKDAETALKVLARGSEFLSALNSETGIHLLSGIISEHKRVAEHILHLAASTRSIPQSDIDYFSILQKQINIWAEEISSFESKLSDIDKVKIDTRD